MTDILLVQGQRLSLFVPVRLLPGAGKYIFMDNIPTSAAGLPSGAIYNDGGTLKVA